MSAQKKIEVIIGGVKTPVTEAFVEVFGKTEDSIEEKMSEVGQYFSTGKTWSQVAKKLGIHRSTLYDWASKIPILADVIKDASYWAKDKVEASLYKLATGFSYEVVEEELISEVKNGVKVDRVTKRKTKTMHVNPDMGAIAFYLCNKDKDNWKRRPELYAPLDDGTVFVIQIPQAPTNGKAITDAQNQTKLSDPNRIEPNGYEEV